MNTLPSEWTRRKRASQHVNLACAGYTQRGAAAQATEPVALEQRDSNRHNRSFDEAL
jgi:hypothetical protein